MNLCRQIPPDRGNSVLIGDVFFDLINVPTNRLCAHRDLSGLSANISPWRQRMIVQTRVDGTERSLFGHHNPVGSQCHQGSGAHSPVRDYDFKVLTEGSYDVDHTPCSRSATAVRFQHQANPLHRADGVENSYKRRNCVGGNLGLESRALTRDERHDFCIALSLDLVIERPPRHMVHSVRGQRPASQNLHLRDSTGLVAGARPNELVSLGCSYGVDVASPSRQCFWVMIAA